MKVNNTNFEGLKILIEGMNDDEYMMDHDLNLTILSPDIKRRILAHLNLSKKEEVSRFLTMIICFLENESIDEEMVTWTDEDYRLYLEKCEISEDIDNQYVEEFLLNFQCRFF